MNEERSRRETHALVWEEIGSWSLPATCLLLSILALFFFPDGWIDLINHHIRDIPIKSDLVDFLVLLVFLSGRFGPAVALLLLAWLSRTRFVGLRRIFGRATLKFSELFSGLGLAILTRRTAALWCVLLATALGAVLLTASYYNYKEELRQRASRTSLVERLLEMILRNPTLHYRERESLGKVERVASEAGYDLEAEMPADPVACLLLTIDSTVGSQSNTWRVAQKRVADLLKRVPKDTAGQCSRLHQWLADPQQLDPADQKALLGLVLVVAEANQSLGLEGSDIDRSHAAAKTLNEVQLLIGRLGRAVPAEIEGAFHNALGRHFSVCFSRFARLACNEEPVPESLRCRGEETCFETALSSYNVALEEDASDYAKIRCENNTIDLVMKALLKFAGGGDLPSYVAETLRNPGTESLSPASWLSHSIDELDGAAQEARVAPEIFVTLAQLASLRLAYGQPGEEDQLVEQAVDFLFVAKWLHGLPYPFLAYEPKDRGWCPLFQGLLANDRFKGAVGARFGALSIDISANTEGWLRARMELCGEDS